MNTYIDFKTAQCKNCNKCLRECGVKAITVGNHQAKVINDRCILCGTCTLVCPQNAKIVHSELDTVKAMLKEKKKVIASVAPSFLSSFNLGDFNPMRIALGKLGFTLAEETAIGAKIVTDKYQELLKGGTYKNFITSSCPSINAMIQLYYPKALPYLAKVDSPMIAHAKLIKDQYSDASIVFIGPCIAKKKEAKESGLIDAVLTFEELDVLFTEKNISFLDMPCITNYTETVNKARFYPISRGIIKSFDGYVDGYEYLAIDGIAKAQEILENISELNGIFLELNGCEYACVNGPCAIKQKGGAVKGNANIRKYASQGNQKAEIKSENINIDKVYPRLRTESAIVTERDIISILAKTNKTKKEDELNCGSCGYSTCREKAWAVANGYADLEMCLPFMRERAETMSYEIIQNSPNGIIVLDFDLKIVEINRQAKKMLGIDADDLKGVNLVDYYNPTDFILAQLEHKKTLKKKDYIEKTHTYVELNIMVLDDMKVMFGIFQNITEDVDFNKKLTEVRLETIMTTDQVIKKHMRVAQEIASLLGETTAETKVALLKLKKALSENEEI